MKTFNVGDKVKHWSGPEIGTVYEISQGKVKARFPDGTIAWSNLEGYVLETNKEYFQVLFHLTPLEKALK